MKILHLSDSSLHSTGYANQTRLLCNTLSKAGHSVYQLGHNHSAMATTKTVLEDGEEIDYTLIGTDGSPYCRDVLPDYFQKYKPQIFTILLDTFMLMQANVNGWNIPAKSVFWYPSDGGWFPKFCDQVLRKVDYPVAMAKYGQMQAKEQFGINAHYIPHGVRSDIFYPYDDDKKYENRLKYSQGMLYAFKGNMFFPLTVDLTDKFIVGCVARNQSRKNLPEAIKAFCEFAKDKEDVVLVLHSDPVDNAAVCNLQELADRWGQGHKIMWTAMRIWNPYTQTRMRDLYNLFDMFFLVTSGEGFGIPFVEAMSCEIPIVATDYTTTKELVTDNDAGIAVKLMGEDERPYPAEKRIFNGTITGTWEVERGLADFYDSVKKLNEMYDKKEMRQKFGKNARQAVLKHYDWNKVVGPAWTKFIAEIGK